MRQFKELGIAPPVQGFSGDKIKISKILNKNIVVHAFRIVNSRFEQKGNGKCLHIAIEFGGSRHVVFTGSVTLQEMLNKVPPNDFPFETVITQENERFEFT